jgi:hypothetical protein
MAAQLLALPSHLDRRQDTAPQRQPKCCRTQGVLGDAALNLAERSLGLPIPASAASAAVKRRAALECSLELSSERVAPRCDRGDG